MLRRLNTPRRRIASKLVWYILLCSSLVTLILTALQLYRDYQHDISVIESRFEQIRIGSLPSLIDDLWVINSEALALQINGLHSLPDMHYLVLRDGTGETVVSAGEGVPKHVIETSFDLHYEHRGTLLKIGDLYVAANLDGVYQRLIDKAMVILVSQATKTFIVSAFIFLIFQWLVTRHLSQIANYAGNMDVQGYGEPLALERREDSHSHEDELGVLVTAFNTLRENQRQTYEALLGHRARLQDEVDRRTRELAHANDDLASFSYSISHDMRAPLRAINGFARILEQEYGDELDQQAHNHLQRIFRSANRLGDMIDDLLRLSQVSRAQLNFRLVNLSVLCRDIMADLREREPGRQVECVVADCAPVTGDQGLLRLLLSNLLANAWKYTGRTTQARIEFGCGEEAGRRVFFVRDNGAGFDMQYAGKLFQPFQRLHGEDEFEGTGIGLATVRRVMIRHHGEVWARAEEGKGATFCFSFDERLVE